MENDSIREFRAALRELEREIGSRLRSETSCCGVTVNQCHFLLELERSVTCSLVELEEKLGIDRSILSRITDSLVKEGLVNRIPSEADRRYIELRLTKKGMDKAEGINSYCDSIYINILSVLDPEEREILKRAVPLLAEVLKRGRLPAEGEKCCAPDSILRLPGHKTKLGKEADAQ